MGRFRQKGDLKTLISLFKIQVTDQAPICYRLTCEGAEARTVDEAISVLRLSGGEPTVDKHPEKRMKAAYEEFEQARLPLLKAENGNMRLSQLKQMLRKEWQKHPDNPLNKRLAAAMNQ